VLSGKAGSNAPIEVAIGVNYIPADLIIKDAHKRDIKFSHFISREDKSQEVAQVAGGKASIKVKV
jgi:hypothetical protein